MEYNTKPLVQLAESVAKKLQKMHVPKNLKPTTPHHQVFNDLLTQFELMEDRKTDIAAANSLQVKEYMRAAAQQVAKECYRGAEMGAVVSIIELLRHLRWKMANVIAHALVEKFTTPEIAREAIARGENAERGEYPFRCFLHCSSDSVEEDISKVAVKIESGFREHFTGMMVLEEMGWMHGAITSADGLHGSADGLFLIVCAKEWTVALGLKVFLSELGCVPVSVVQMFDLTRASSIT